MSWSSNSFCCRSIISRTSLCACSPKTARARRIAGSGACGGRAGHRVHQVAYAASARARTRGGRSRTAADAVRTRTRRIRTLIGTRGIRGTLIGTRRIRGTLIGTIAGTEIICVVEPPTLLGRRRRLRLRRLRRLVRARGRAVGALARVRNILGPHALLDVHEEPRVREVPTRAGAEDVPAAGRHLNVRVRSRGGAHPGAASRAGEENRGRGHARGVVVVVVGELRERGAQRPARAREMPNARAPRRRPPAEEKCRPRAAPPRGRRPAAAGGPPGAVLPGWVAIAPPGSRGPGGPGPGPEDDRICRVDEGG